MTDDSLPPYVTEEHLKQFVTKSELNAELAEACELLGRMVADALRPVEKAVEELDATALREGGVWDASKHYAPGQCVTCGGALFVCKNANTGQRPGTATAMWRLLLKSHGKDSAQS